MTLRSARLNANLSQSEAARQIGVEKSSLSGYETGKRVPKYSTLERMAQLYKVDIADLECEDYPLRG